MTVKHVRRNYAAQPPVGISKTAPSVPSSNNMPSMNQPRMPQQMMKSGTEQSEDGKKNWIVGIILILLLVAALIYFFNKQKGSGRMTSYFY